MDIIVTVKLCNLTLRWSCATPTLTISYHFMIEINQELHIVDQPTPKYQCQIYNNYLTAICSTIVYFLWYFIVIKHSNIQLHIYIFSNILSFQVATILLACAEASEYIQHLVFYIVMAVCILEVFFEILFEFVVSCNSSICLDTIPFAPSSPSFHVQFIQSCKYNYMLLRL